MSQAKTPVPKITLAFASRKQNEPAPKALSATYHGPTDNQLPSDASMSVVTNYVAVNKLPELVYVYRVEYADIAPSPADIAAGKNNFRPISQRSQKIKIFKALSQTETGSPLYLKKNWATDYESVWSLQPLTNDAPDALDNTSAVLSNVNYRKQGGRVLTVPQVAFYYMRTLTFGRGTQDLARGINKQSLTLAMGSLTIGRDNAAPPTQPIPNVLTTALNAMLTKHVTSAGHNKLHLVGGNKFFVKNSALNRDGIDILRGYFTSVRPGEQAILLNINPTHAAFIPPILVSDFISKMEKYAGDYKSAETYLRTKSARVIYDRPQSSAEDVKRNDEEFRVKTIADFGNIPKQQLFFDGAGKQWSVEQWFKEQGLVIKSPHIKCVNVGLPSHQRALPGRKGPKTGGQLWIPAEFLELLPYQPFPKKLNPVHMQHMHNIALRQPADNHCSLVKEGLPLLGIGNKVASDLLKKHLQLETGNALLLIPATQMQPPAIIYKSGGKDSKKPVAKASWNLLGIEFYAPRPKPTQSPLAVLDLRGPLHPDEKAGRELGHGFLDVLSKHALAASPGPLSAADKHVRCVQGDTAPPGKGPQWVVKYGDMLQEWLVRVAGAPSVGIPPRVLVILNDSDASVYEGIKRLAETLFGYSTICVTRGKVCNAQPSLWSNLALKYNIKGGGINHVVECDNKAAFSKLESDTMVLGADVVHPGDNVPSIAALVGSVDKHFINMPGSIRLQGAREEIIEPTNMLAMVTQRLSAYRKSMGKLPAHILYYRDGVGEDQYSEVLDVEVPEIKRAHATLSKLANTTGPPKMTMPGQKKPTALKITVIVVGKRHNTRFFAPNNSSTYEDKAGSGNFNGNVTPGFVVDSVITQPPGNDNFEDFFMQSHAALAGTARSAHYVILQNGDPKLLPLKEIQRITHAFCYTYARATKGVSYCAPAYNADRLCDRAHAYLKGWLVQTNAEATWGMNEEEEALTKDAGQRTFRRRIRDEVEMNQSWNRGRGSGRPGPWVEAMDGIMFWL